MIQLSKLSVGEQAFITKITSDKKQLRRLLSLGFRVGTAIEVVQWRKSGVVLANANNRIALSGSLISKFWVSLSLDAPATQIIQ